MFKTRNGILDFDLPPVGYTLNNITYIYFQCSVQQICGCSNSGNSIVLHKCAAKIINKELRIMQNLFVPLVHTFSFLC